jgi:site-specific recombinase XerD
MKKRNQTYGRLSVEFLNYLEKLKYAQKTVEGYRYRINHIRKMLPKGNLTLYNYEAWQLLVESLSGNKQWNVQESYVHSLLFTADAIFEYGLTGSFTARNANSSTAKLEFGAFSGDINKYLDSLRAKLYAGNSIKEHCKNAVRLQEFLVYRGTKKLSDINKETVIEYVRSLGSQGESSCYRILCCTRVFLKYLNDTGILSQDLSYVIPKLGAPQPKKVPSIYSGEEVSKLLASINRASPVGKRNYAIILLATRLGLRAGDISTLEFSHVKWEKNLIEKQQQKTGNLLSLPLLAEVGNALVDYIKYGRPESNSSRIFLQARPRFEPLRAQAVCSVFSNLSNKGGVLAKPGRKHGPHAFRHSLVSELLSYSTPFPIIKEILGHKSSESTMMYARIDLKSLNQCVLNVSPIPPHRFDTYALSKGGPND